MREAHCASGRFARQFRASYVRGGQLVRVPADDRVVCPWYNNARSLRCAFCRVRPFSSGAKNRATREVDRSIGEKKKKAEFAAAR